MSEFLNKTSSENQPKSKFKPNLGIAEIKDLITMGWRDGNHPSQNA
jgi:hypothetical protein